MEEIELKEYIISELNITDKELEEIITIILEQDISNIEDIKKLFKNINIEELKKYSKFDLLLMIANKLKYE